MPLPRVNHLAWPRCKKPVLLRLCCVVFALNRAHIGLRFELQYSFREAMLSSTVPWETLDDIKRLQHEAS
jgi:hypothetical protein